MKRSHNTELNRSLPKEAETTKNNNSSFHDWLVCENQHELHMRELSFPTYASKLHHAKSLRRVHVAPQSALDSRMFKSKAS